MTDALNLKPVDHIQLNPDFIQTYLDLLPEGLREGTLEQFIGVEVERYEIVQNALYQLAVGRLLSEAKGAYLDDIGARFQIYRNGLDDDEYRATIYLKTGSSQKHGTRNEIVQILENLFGVGSVDTYKGNNFRFDVAVSSPCFGSTATAEDIAELMPLVTDLRVVSGLGVPFGFDGDSKSGGFGSIHDIGPDFDIGVTGSFYSLEYKSDYDI